MLICRMEKELTPPTCAWIGHRVGFWTENSVEIQRVAEMSQVGGRIARVGVTPDVKWALSGMGHPRIQRVVSKQEAKHE